MTDYPTPQPEDASDEPGPHTGVPHAILGRPLSEAARRALLEAAARRAASAEAEQPTEHGGPGGPEPTRYGDWEKKGLAIDF